MPVAIRHSGDVSIVELSGEFALERGQLSRPLDLQGKPLEDFSSAVNDLLDGNHVRIVIDMEKVRFIDSSGLGQVVAWKKRAAQLGGDVRLCRLQQRVRDVFELLLLTRVFAIFDSQDEAVASFHR